MLVMASGYSRWMLGLMIPSRHAEDLVLGTWRLLQQLGEVPGQQVWDNEDGVGKYRGRGCPPALSRQFAEFRGLLGCEVVVLPPREPEHKGIGSGTTITWRPRSCRAGSSPRRRISTPSRASGWRGRTPGSSGC